MEKSMDRYQCQIALPEFGSASQDLLHDAKVLIVGIGGLGCPAAQYLAAAGIGTIGIADDDMISLSNLHRQILYTPEEIGLSKAQVSCQKLQKQNPDIQIKAHPVRVTSENVMDLIKDYDLIVEGTDNFETKCLLNDACVLAGKPLVYGAIYQYEGQVSIWNVLQEDGSRSVNYRDIFPDAENSQIPNCSEGGVIPTLAGIVGCMQANEVIKYFTLSKDLLAGKLWLMNVMSGKTSIIKLKGQTSVEIYALNESVCSITRNELHEKLKQNGTVLIDVRTKEEHQLFNIGGENFPLDDLENYLNQIAEFEKIIFYCASGNRSSKAVRMIKKIFPTQKVYSLKNGIEQYRHNV